MTVRIGLPEELLARFDAEAFGNGARYHVFHAPNSVFFQKVRAVFFAA